jgi:3-deoxy-manno-octulosonate cytidylyltransferase (CMP-KDO synthetase)
LTGRPVSVLMVHDKILCVIPARFSSTRLPGKPLILIKNIPLVVWVYNRAKESGVFDEVRIATDDRRILDIAALYGAVAVMTSASHVSGTDRVREASAALRYNYIVNIQGDEPLIPAETLRTMARHMGSIDDNSLLTCVSNATIEDGNNPNVVKVVCNEKLEALYFSRSLIPYDRDHRGARALKHRGIYGFTKAGLSRFCDLPHGRLERTEKLEQLRALERGMRIKCFLSDFDGISIDTPEDVDVFKKMVEG